MQLDTSEVGQLTWGNAEFHTTITCQLDAPKALHLGDHPETLTIKGPRP